VGQSTTRLYKIEIRIMAYLIVVLGIMAAPPPPTETPPRVRVAAFNIWELSRSKLDQVDAGGRGCHPQLCNAAQIIQRVRPDILLVNEIDYDADRRENAHRFLTRYLAVGQSGQEPVQYTHVFFEPVNTGLPTGRDLDNDGQTDGPADAFGYGRYPGQYGMALFSRFPIDRKAARTFQKVLWQDMPGNLMPDGNSGKPAWYNQPEAAVLRLSSKSHWDVPVRVGNRIWHMLASHPTPPVFDGPEDRNGRRMFDEIRLWADYVTGGPQAAYIVDDRGRRGGLAAGALFVVLGDLNAEPDKDPRTYGRAAIDQLLQHRRILDPRPQGAEGTKTSGFGRLDYVLPCRELRTLEAGVFWPPPEDATHRLIVDRRTSSDHRLVWVDIAVDSAAKGPDGRFNRINQSKETRDGRD
jgi:endonuclease/exonuclease/phosphatase family metal-dependent hydrolase